MNRILSRMEIKERAKAALHGRYWTVVLSLLVTGVIVAAAIGLVSALTGFSFPIMDIVTGTMDEEELALSLLNILGAQTAFMLLAGLINLVVRPVLECGTKIVLLRAYRGQKTSIQDIFEVRRSILHVFGGLLYQELFLFLWGLIPLAGPIIVCVKRYAYCMTPFLLVNRPEIGATEALKTSIRMTDGQKATLFVVDLSFIGWFLLSALTFNILSVFYVNPYYLLTYAGYYDELERETLGGAPMVYGGGSAEPDGGAVPLTGREPIPATTNGRAEGLLQAMTGEYAGALFPVSGLLTLGRDPEYANIILTTDPKVSRRHCAIRFDAQTGLYYVTDYSSNGTFLANGTRLPQQKELPIRSGTVIYIASAKNQFRLR